MATLHHYHVFDDSITENEPDVLFSEKMRIIQEELGISVNLESLVTNFQEAPDIRVHAISDGEYETLQKQFETRGRNFGAEHAYQGACIGGCISPLLWNCYPEIIIDEEVKVEDKCHMDTTIQNDEGKYGVIIEFKAPGRETGATGGNTVGEHLTQLLHYLMMVLAEPQQFPLRSTVGHLSHLQMINHPLL